MDLIDTYQLTLYQQNLNLTNNKFFNNLHNSFVGLPVQINYLNQMQYQFLFLVKRIGARTVLSKGKIKNGNILTLNLNTVLQKIQSYAISVQRTKALRRMFKISSKLNYINLKVQPNSGQFTCKSSTLLSLNSFKFNGADILSYFVHIYEIIIEQFQTILSQILFQLNYEVDGQNISADKNLKLANELKIFSKSAPHYAWNILQSNTKSSKKHKNYIYQQSKSRFRKMKPSFNSKKKNILIMNRILCSGIRLINPFFMLKLHEDQELKNNYLLGKALNKNQKLINRISLSEMELKQLQNCDLIKTRNQQGEKIKLVAYKKQITKKQLYELKILQKLSQFQFSGIPKYYYHSKLKQQSPTLILTNLIQFNPYTQFIQNNQKTISISTKLLLLAQISNALRYLRDHKIVYHNLIPTNIIIRKGLVLKITDFTNSFNQQIDRDMLDQRQQNNSKDIEYKPYQNKLPYVYNVVTCRNKSFDDQRADVYSLGLVMYQLLFSKNPINIKSSKYTSLQNIKQLENILINTDNMNCINGQVGKIIGNFLLSSFTHQFISKNQSQSDFDKRVDIKKRPLLDWFSIIIKHLSVSID